MGANESKLLPVKTSCIEYVHPWTDSCYNATAGLLVVSALDSFRLYTIVYVVKSTFDLNSPRSDYTQL